MRQHPLPLIKTDERGGLIFIDFEASFDRLGPIIAPLDQRLAAPVTALRLFRRCKIHMKRGLAFRTAPAPAEAFHNVLAGDLKIDHSIQPNTALSHHGLERFCLWNSPRKSIEHKSLCAACVS